MGNDLIPNPTGNPPELDAECPLCGVPLLLEHEGTNPDTDPDTGRCPECDGVFPVIY